MSIKEAAILEGRILSSQSEQFKKLSKTSVGWKNWLCFWTL